MAIAILPMLVETFATGSVAVVAGMAAWYLFKHEKVAKKTSHQEDQQTPTEANTTTLSKQDSPPSTITETPASETVSVAKVEEAAATEEPMLKRHYLHNVRMMLMTINSPAPTDSMLSRHYEENIDAQAEECLANDDKMQRLVDAYEALSLNKGITADEISVIEEACAEEPVLKRHYLNNIRLMLMATTFPEPTDSILNRHYDEMIDAKAEECLENEEKLARLVAEYEAFQQSQPEVEAEAEVVTITTTAPATTTQAKASCIPEDSMLKRHFLSKLRAEIEKTKASRPSDSILRRHYEAMINAELENCLACH